MAPLISVCIPVFNGEKYIRECLSSVLAQSEKNLEVLVMDNCSTDRTPDILNEFHDPRIRVIKNAQNVGSIENFCRGIQNARGELFMLLPCDDRLEDNCLEELSRGLIENPSAGIAYGSHIQIDQQGQKTGIINLTVKENGLCHCKEAARLIAEQFNPIQHPLVRSKAFSEVGLFDKSFGCFCDIHLWTKILFKGWNAYVVNKPLTSMRNHKDQGQSLFLQNTKNNLKKLSSHYGQSLTADFYKKIHFNFLYFKFVQYFNDAVDHRWDISSNLKNLMIRHLVESHLHNIYLSIRCLNPPSFFAELKITVKLIRLYGLIKILNDTVFITFSLFKKTFLSAKKIIEVKPDNALKKITS